MKFYVLNTMGDLGNDDLCLLRNFVDGKLHAETTVTSLQPNQPPLPKRYELPPGMTEITGNEQ